MAHALNRSSCGLVVVVGLLAGCYAPQAVNVNAVVADWRAEQSQVTLPDQASGWTAQALVARALRANPEVLAWQARVDASGAAVDAAGEFDDLELRITEGKLDQLVDADPTFEIAVRGRPPRPGDLASREDAARLRVEEVAAERDAAERRLKARVRGLHARAVLSAQELEVALAEAEVRAKRLRWETDRTAQQAGSNLDVALAELDRAEVADEAAELALEREQALAELRQLIDLPAHLPLVLEGAPGGVDASSAPIELSSRQRWIDGALASRSELRGTGAALARSKADAYRAEVEQWPWLGYVQLSYEANEKSGPLTWGFALALDLPIFAWTGSKVAAQDAVTRRRQVEHRGMVSRIAHEVDGALETVVLARTRLDGVRASLLPAVAAAARLAEDAEATQALDAFRVVRLQVSRLRAQRRHLSARRAWILARVRLDEVAGR